MYSTTASTTSSALSLTMYLLLVVKVITVFGLSSTVLISSAFSTNCSSFNLVNFIISPSRSPVILSTASFFFIIQHHFIYCKFPNYFLFFDIISSKILTFQHYFAPKTPFRIIYFLFCEYTKENKTFFTFFYVLTYNNLYFPSMLNYALSTTLKLDPKTNKHEKHTSPISQIITALVKSSSKHRSSLSTDINKLYIYVHIGLGNISQSYCTCKHVISRSIHTTRTIP